jgi:hypothetical protein
MNAVRLAPILACTLATAACGGHAPDFDADVAAAKANLATDEGEKYAVRIGRYFQTDAMRESKRICLTEHPGQAGMYRGVYRFAADGSYKLEVRPDDELAACLVKIHENLDPPPPPSLPYVQMFEFEAKAPAR